MKVTVLLLLLFIHSRALACGSPSMFLAGYTNLGPNADLATRERALDLVLGSCIDHTNYLPGNDDELIASVAIDAMENRLPREKVEALLQQFHCAFGARDDEEYSAIRSFVGEQRFDEFCDSENLNRIYIVNASSGAVLRDAPSTSGERLIAIPEGGYVKRIAQEGSWYQVDGGLYGNGYIYGALLRPY